MPLRAGEARKIAVKKGWVHYRTTGSHHIYRHPDRDDLLNVPGADHKELHGKTLVNIKRQLGIK